MAAKIISIILLVVGIVLFVLRLLRVVALVDIPDSFVTSAVLIAGGAVGLALSERSK